uniref:Uncharacterized protein n=1 Tax=Arundo donax TaxID=35708 RepID=A0A0A9ABC0_ARUDO
MMSLYFHLLMGPYQSILHPTHKHHQGTLCHLFQNPDWKNWRHWKY